MACAKMMIKQWTMTVVIVGLAALTGLGLSQLNLSTVMQVADIGGGLYGETLHLPQT